MRKKNKIIQFIKSNWYFILLVIPIILVCYDNKMPNNDVWFLMNNGRYVLNNGFTHVDPFTIHKGFHYIMQQWLSSVLFYGVFAIFGKYGLWAIVIVFLILIEIVLYKICYYISEDKVKSVIITTIILCISKEFFVTRPQIVTYLILLLETLCLEKYINNKNWKSLLPLPFLSILLINCNCAMWYMQFIFILPFIVDIIFTKKNKKKYLKDLLIVIVVMVLVGFINPYGIESITYIFTAYGLDEINGNILEMYYSVMNYNTWVISNILLFLYAFIGIHMCKKKNDIRFTFFVIGTFFLSSIHRKCIIYFLLWSAYAFSSFDVTINIKGKIKRIIKAKWFVLIKRIVYVLVVIFIMGSFFLVGIKSVKNYSIKYENERMIRYILKNYDKKKVRLFNQFHEGGFAEFMGLKSYIDPRAELFVKEFNGVTDIFDEYGTMLYNPSDEYIEYFLSNYKFTHIIVPDGTKFEYYLSKSDDYICEYELYANGNRKEPYELLYVRKDISIENDN